MAQSTISIRVDKTLKQNFDALCEMFGLSTTAAFNIFMKAVVREKRIPFEIKAETPEDIRQKAREAFDFMRKSLTQSGMDEMTIEEINAEIKAVRDERQKNICSH